jgi:hypothetical protein
MMTEQATEGSTPSALISIQPLKQACTRQPLPYQIDGDFVGLQDGYKIHYAALIHEDVSVYLQDRRQEPLSFVQVGMHIPKMHVRFGDKSKLDSLQATRLPLLVNENRVSIPAPISYNINLSDSATSEIVSRVGGSRDPDI